jgi:hypothetical protein
MKDLEKKKPTFNLIHNDIILNKIPLSEEKAKLEQGLIIINYGYKPEIIKL